MCCVICINIIDRSILPSFAILTAAVGAGLGFGAQKLIGDILNGIFLVIEDQLGVGDEVDLGFAQGLSKGLGFV